MIVAAADGSSLSNPGPAGWAWYIDDEHWGAGGWPHGTNNMGELKAVLDLLSATEDTDEPLRILCDSQYVINALTKWLPGWKRKGWKKADGKPVLNQDLLKALDAALDGRDVTFQWVKGHAGHALNEAADARARAAATAYQDHREPDRGPGFGGSSVSVPPASAKAVDENPVDVREVVALEKKLLSDEVRRDPDRMRDMLHPQFSEFGATGRISTRARTLAEAAPLPVRLTFDLIGADELAPGVVLLRWRGVGAAGTWLRSSIWQRVDGRWQQRFAQATQANR